MRVSWLIPVRDGRRWLAESLASALAECGPDDEVVVVDDGSQDQPEAVRPDDGRVVWITRPAEGISAALEAGRRASRGRYIARLDADDVALPGRIKAQLSVLEANIRVAAVGGQAEICREDGPVPEGMARYVTWVNGLTDLQRELLVESPLFHPAVTLRSDVLDEVGGYRSGDFPEDYDLWLRLVSAGWRLASVPMRVVALRDRSDRLTRTDPRYRRAAFRELKMAWLQNGPLRHPTRVVVWGGGREGRPWIRWLRSQGHTVPFVVDLSSGGNRQGVPVVTESALVDGAFDQLLVAVGARGARDLIRSRVQLLRPELVEGRDWWAVA